MHVLINTRNSSYLFTPEVDSMTGTLVRTQTSNPAPNVYTPPEAILPDVHTEVPIEHIRKAVVGERLSLSSAEGGLLTSTVERVLQVLTFAEVNTGAMLPMVTNRCGCGNVVDIFEPEVHKRDWHPTRVNGNSQYGYEPYCFACDDKAEQALCASAAV